MHPLENSLFSRQSCHFSRIGLSRSTEGTLWECSRHVLTFLKCTKWTEHNIVKLETVTFIAQSVTWLGYRLDLMVMGVRFVARYAEWTKNLQPNLRKVNLHHSTKTIWHEHRPSDAWFLNCGLLKVSTLNVHAGIAGDRLLWIYLFPPRLTGAVYHDFVRNVLPQLLEEVNLQIRIHLWSVHDGAPPRLFLAVRKLSSATFGNSW